MIWICYGFGRVLNKPLESTFVVVEEVVTES